MKKKYHRNGATRKREMLIVPERGEALNPKQASWLKECPHRTFLEFGFTYESGARDATLIYDVEGLVSLRKYLKRTCLDMTRLTQLLVDIALVQIYCTNGVGRYATMLFDSNDVFVDADGHLSFVFVPLDGLEPKVDNSPLALLKVLSNIKGLKLESQNVRVVIERLAQFVLNENDVFSLNHFRAFIKQECWIDVKTDGTVSRIEGSSVDASIETGGYDDDEQKNDATGSDEGSEYTFVRMGSGERHALDFEKLAIVGRGTECRVRLLGNSRMGRQHAALKCTDEGLVLQDLGSGNGTTLDGYRLEPSYAVCVPYGTRFLLADEECMVERWDG